MPRTFPHLHEGLSEALEFPTGRRQPRTVPVANETLTDDLFERPYPGADRGLGDVEPSAAFRKLPERTISRKVRARSVSMLGFHSSWLL
jgi:hypothetical protein